MPDLPHPPHETADRPEGRSALVFDAAFYLAANPDLAPLAEQPGFEAEEHFWREGIWDGRAPSAFYDIAHLQRVLNGPVSPAQALPLFFALPPEARPVPNGWFDPLFVRRRHGAALPELAGLADFALFTFYADNAGPLALSPNALFDEAGYQARSPDVAAGVAAGLIASGLRHFVTAGWREGRGGIPGAWAGMQPDPAMRQAERDALLARAAAPAGMAWWFDEDFYFALHRDVHAMHRAGQVRSGLAHFLEAGFAEGRIPHPALFAAFRDRAPGAGLVDVLRGHAPPGEGAAARLTLGDAIALRRLVLERGWSADEPEIAAFLWELVAPAPIPGRFDPAAYLAANPDVAGMIARNEVADAASHWRAAGMAEGRLAPCSAVFPGRRASLRRIGGGGVNYIGPLSLATEPGEAARDMLAALAAAGIAVAPVDVSGLLDAQARTDLVAPADLPHGITLLDLPPERILALVARFGADLLDRRLTVGLFPALPPRPEWRAVLGGLDVILTGRGAAGPLAAITGRTVLALPRPLDLARLRRMGAGAAHPVLDRLRAEQQAGRRIVLFTMAKAGEAAARGLDLFLALARRIEADRPGAFRFCAKAAARSAGGPGLAPLVGDAPVLLADEPWSEAQMAALRALADLAVFPDRAPGSPRAALASIALGVPTLVGAPGEAAALLGADYPLAIPGVPAEAGIGAEPGGRPGATWFEPDLDEMLARFAAHFDAPRRFAPWPRRVARLLAPATIGAELRALLAAHCGLEGRLERLGETLDAAGAQDFTVGPRPDDARLGPAITGALAPLFTVVTPADGARPEAVAALYADLVAQDCPAWDWCLASSGPGPDWLAALKQADARIMASGHGPDATLAPDAALAVGAGRFLLFLDAADRVEPDLLAAYAARIAADPGADLLYCDEDAPATGATFRRPDWSPEYLLGEMYLGRAFCIRKSLFFRIGGARAGIGPAGLHDLVLRAAAAGARVVHLPRLLHHAGPVPSEPAEAGMVVLAAHLERLGLAGTVQPGLLPATFRIRPRLTAGRPSGIILSGCERAPGDTGPVLHVERFLRSMLAHGGLPLDIDVVVDRGREGEVAHLAALAPGLRILPYDPPAGGFNFAAKANHAIRAARGESVILLNDDMEALDAGWAEALLEPLELPGVGIVGARLLYPDGTLQHAGIALGGPGAATHPFVGLAEDAVGANGATHVMRNCAAVTAACMAFRRGVFAQAGGFDERFAVDFNDTDFCLRVLSAGLRVVYTPFARLRHHESQTVVRARADTLERHAFRRRWPMLIGRDPYRGAD